MPAGWEGPLGHRPSFVLDTSLFTNPEVASQFGDDTDEAVTNFLALAKQTSAAFYMPTSVYEELRLIKGLEALAPEFESVVQIRSPRKYTLQVPGALLYELMEELRHRIDHGLRVAEEHTKLAGQTGSSDTSIGLDQLISRLRERYRETLRRGILDSKEDVDVLLLALELDAFLVSADKGMCRWADKIGIKLFNAKHFRYLLRSLIKTQEPFPQVAQ
ncbi:RNA ligase partner protein [Candidatus Methylacidithermus pantelleriae]|uniref:RNA-free ribonuclease P n=1 Tax=Candidatus Methylacidithermus pantelleriae TaxID=2744239 RepID=A0A8J2BLM6_9BACT|nr:RNA ligase partner protein [Candidatus Methylacidithermus pantelleriae]CAF0703571.1 RNA-free ribonuclease P [Candidatus Methylacidithermus pantelleriae]